MSLLTSWLSKVERVIDRAAAWLANRLVGAPAAGAAELAGKLMATELGGDVEAAISAVDKRLQAAHATYLDPAVFAAEQRLSPTAVLLALRQMERVGKGRYAVIVRDSDGLEVASFDSFADVPRYIDSPFDGQVPVTEANTDLVFKVGHR